MKDFEHKLENYNKITLVRLLHQLLNLDFDDANDNHIDFFGMNKKHMIRLINAIKDVRKR